MSNVHPNTKHGMTGSTEYTVWQGMLQRCSNPNSEKWHWYGGRGISVCIEWLEFDNFYKDMGNRPEGKTLDRINVNGDYSPENCRWATPEEQMRNVRTNHHITYNGKTQILQDWANELGISAQTICRRINHYGWSAEKALSTPVNSTKGNKGVKNAMAKYSVELIQKVKAALADGIGGRKVSEMFDIPESTVSQIKTGRRWAEVEAIQ